MTTRIPADLRRGALGVADQSIVSATSFVTSIIVGREDGPEALAMYSLAVTLLLLASAAHDALIALPYTIRVRQYDCRTMPAYTGDAMRFSAALGAVAAAVLAGVSLVVWTARSSGSSVALLPAPLLAITAVAAPAVLLRDLARRIAAAHLQMGRALRVDVSIATLQLGALAVLASVGAVTPSRALTTMCVACAAGFFMWLWLWRRDVRVDRRRVPPWREHWALGRWVLASRITSYLRSETMVLWMLAIASGPHATGVFAACLTVALLCNPLVLGVGLFLTPRFSEALRNAGEAELRRRVRLALLVLGTMLAGFVGAIAIAGPDALRLLYGDRYAGAGHMPAILAAVVSVGAASLVFDAALLALKRPQANFMSSAAGLAAMVAIAPAAIAYFGSFGAAAALLGGNATDAAVRMRLFLRETSPPSANLTAAARAAVVGGRP